MGSNFKHLKRIMLVNDDGIDAPGFSVSCSVCFRFARNPSGGVLDFRSDQASRSGQAEASIPVGRTGPGLGPFTTAGPVSVDCAVRVRGAATMDGRPTRLGSVQSVLRFATTATFFTLITALLMQVSNLQDELAEVRPETGRMNAQSPESPKKYDGDYEEEKRRPKKKKKVMVVNKKQKNKVINLKYSLILGTGERA